MTTYHNLYCEKCRDFRMHKVSDNSDKKEQTIECLHCGDVFNCIIEEDRVKVEKDIHEKWVEYERRANKAS